jgi:hypothetical protein
MKRDSRLRRALAALAAPLLLASTTVAAVAVMAPAAEAYGPTALNLNCWVVDVSTSNAPWNGANHTLTLSGGTTVGSNVNVSYTYSIGPNNGGPKADQSVKAEFEVTQGGNTTYVMSNSVALGQVPNSQPSPTATLTASIPATAEGNLTIKVRKVVFTATLFGLDVVCNSQTSGTATVNPYTVPVTTPIGDTVAITTGSTGTPTDTSSPTPTTSSPTPTTSSPTPTTSSSTPTTSSPTPTATSGSPTPTPTVTGVPASFDCTTLGQTKPWSTTLSASLTGTTLNLAFAPGPDNGPVGLNANWLKPVADVTTPAAAKLEGPAYGALAARVVIPGATMSGTVTGSPETVGIKDIVFDDFGSGSDVDTMCKPKTALSVPVQSSPPLPSTPPTSNGDLTVTGTVTAGGKVTLSGSGFKAGTNATAGMYSTPVTLGVGTANAQGQISVEVTIPSGTTGSHTLVLLGTKDDGSPWALTKAVTVTAASSSADPTDDPTSSDDGGDNGGLASTGPEDFGKTLVIALVALQIGLIVAVRAARRPRAAVAGRHRH